MATEKINSGSNSVTAGLVLTESTCADFKGRIVSGIVGGGSAYAGTKWFGESWEFVMQDVLADTEGGSITDVNLNIEIIFSGYSDDEFVLEVYDGSSWNTVITWDSGNPPPSVADTLTSEDVSAILDTWTKINAAKVRIRGTAITDAEDTITIYVDYVELEITYTPYEEEHNYFPNSDNCAGKTWTENVSGDYTDKTPDERGITPASITSGMSDAQENTVSVDDYNEVISSIGSGAEGYTVRTAIMHEIQIAEVEVDVEKLTLLMRGRHYSSGDIAYMYVWKPGASSWENLASFSWTCPGEAKSDHPDSHREIVITSIGDYIDTNKIYVLVWDYTGEYTTGGCLKKGTPLQTPHGLKNIEDVKINEKIMGNSNGNKVKTTVIGKSRHKGKWLLCNYRGIGATEDHEFWLIAKWVEARKLTKQRFEYVGEVFDLVTETGNYYGKGNILIHNRLMKA